MKGITLHKKMNTIPTERIHPRSLSMSHEGSVSSTESKRMFNSIKMQLMEFLWTGVGISCAAWITLAGTKLAENNFPHQN